METVSRIDDIEAGCDVAFERGWGRIQRAGWGVLFLLLVAGVAGLFGNGPLSKETANSPDGALQVRYERLARRETPALLELHFNKRAIASGQVHVRLNHALTDRMRIKNIIPAPLATQLLDDGARFTFQTDPTLDSAMVLLLEDPTGPGIVTGEVVVEGAEPVRFRQFVYP